MNRILLACLFVACLIGAISAQARTGNSASAVSALARSGLFSGRGGGMSSMFPLLALSGGGNDALMPLMLCNRGMNFMCLMALSQGGIM